MCETGRKVKLVGEDQPCLTRICTWRKGAPQPEMVDTLEEIPAGSLSWVHVEAGDTPESRKLLIDRLGFHELEVEDALSAGERAHLHEGPDHLFFTIPAIQMQEQRMAFVEVGFQLKKDRLVTVATEPVSVLDEILKRSQTRNGQYTGATSRLLFYLVDAIIDAYYPAMDKLEDRADTLESEVFVGRVVPIKDLLRVKRRLLEIRRSLTPVRDILNGLLRHDMTLIANADRVYFQDIYDHVLRVLEHVDLSRDVLASVLEANLATVSNRLNEVMRVLTVASVILMSAALIAGIYGMNFRFMPELRWPLGYPLVLGSMAVIAAFELWVFKKKGWL